MLDIHANIKQKLNTFISIKKVPNILFHGPCGCGKKTIVHEFISNIYNNNIYNINQYLLHVNCSHVKGIKFIMDELKFFAKTHINTLNGHIFKSIILINADKLTMDAQSALRRCIELFNHNSRFFIVIENKYKLLKPILSRFCEIYIPELVDNTNTTNTTNTTNNINLYQYNNNKTFNLKYLENKKMEWLKKYLLIQTIHTTNIHQIIDISTKLYNKGYSGLNIMQLLESNTFLKKQIEMKKRYEFLLAFNKIKKEIRNEKLFMTFMLNFIFLGSNISLENISFM